MFSIACSRYKKKTEQPTLWCMLRQSPGEETAMEEAVFVLQGIIVSKDLPPLRKTDR